MSRPPTMAPLRTGSSRRAPAPVPRFTVDGDDALEASLARTCARVVSGLRGLIPARKLEAIVLGGGYGRGEGGILRQDGEDRPYNDLEFYVAVRGNRHLNERIYGRSIEALAHIMTQLAGIEVEFKLCSLPEMARSEPSMFTYDLMAGHRLLWGDARALAPCSAHRRSESVPAAEATRLLMNRCSGLLLAKAELLRHPFTDTAADFVGRNLAKAQLALGDAVLTVAGRYDWSCRERHRRLLQLVGLPAPDLASIRRHHAAGVEFKLHPRMGGASREELAARHEEVSALALRLWLWVESRRLGRVYASARSYASDATDYFPQTSSLRNLILNARSSGLSFWRNTRRRARHPRERVVRALALLLWEPEALSHPALRARLQAELGTKAESFDGLLDAYTRLWKRVQ